MINITFAVRGDEDINPMIENPRKDFKVQIDNFDHFGASLVASTVCQMIEEGYAPIDNFTDYVSVLINPAVYVPLDFLEKVWEIVEETPLDV